MGTKLCDRGSNPRLAIVAPEGVVIRLVEHRNIYILCLSFFFLKHIFSFFFFLQRGQLYIIRRVDAGQDPPIYYLEDLLNHKVPGTFYGPELHKASAPVDNEFHKVEKILKTKRSKGKVWKFVKYLNYPNKFNEWRLETDIK